LTPKDFKEREESEGDVARITARAKAAKKVADDAANLEADQLEEQGRINQQIGEQRLRDEKAQDRGGVAAGKKETAAEKAEAARLKAARRKLQSSAQNAEEDRREARELLGNRGGTMHVPALPSAPAAGGDKGITAQQAQQMVTYLQSISGNTDNLPDDFDARYGGP
jgi:hypothetical protein